MISINKVLLLGEIKKQPETKYFNNKGYIMILNLVTNINNYNSNNKIYNKYNWHRIILNEDLIKKNKKYLKIGVLVFITGKIRTRSWVNEDKNNYITEIIADEIQIIKENNNKSERNYKNLEIKEDNKNQYNYINNNYKNPILKEEEYKNNKLDNNYKNFSYNNYKNENEYIDSGLDYTGRDSDDEEEIEEEDDNYNDEEYEDEI